MFRASSLENRSLSTAKSGDGQPPNALCFQAGKSAFAMAGCCFLPTLPIPRDENWALLPKSSRSFIPGPEICTSIDRVVGKSGSNLRIYSRFAPIPSVHVSPGGSVTFSPVPAEEQNGRNNQAERNDRAERNDWEERGKGGSEAFLSKGAGPDLNERSGMEEGDGRKEKSQQRVMSGGMEGNERNHCSDRNGRNERNERASWVAGHVVYGDAVLASVGTTYSSLGKLRWDDVTTGDWHR
jgi:hypothetical protein